MAEVFEKALTQEDKIEEEAGKTIKDMGKIWKACTDKLTKDGVCYLCKKPIKKKETLDIVEAPPKKIDKGLFVLVAVCKNCK